MHEPDVVVVVDGNAGYLSKDPVVRQRFWPERIDLELRYAADLFRRRAVYNDRGWGGGCFLAGRNGARPRGQAGIVLRERWVGEENDRDESKQGADLHRDLRMGATPC